MATSDKLPDVFHLRPLNNQRMTLKHHNNAPQIILPKDTKILNNVCQCSCHASDEKNSENYYKMIHFRWPKLKRTKCLMGLVGLLCFVIGLALPFIFLNRNTNTISATNGPLNRFLVPQRPLIPIQHKIRNNTLEDVFISVKTTRKYHYPRLIIQLETWVSLVRRQVSIHFKSDNLLNETYISLRREEVLSSRKRAKICYPSCKFEKL